MQRPETELRGKPYPVRIIGGPGSIAYLRHIRRARNEARISGELCGCKTCKQGLESSIKTMQERPEVPESEVVQGERTDEKKTDPLPRSDDKRRDIYGRPL